MPEVSINNLVARLARHTVQLAQLGDAQYLAQVICDKLGLLVHRRGLTPRHGHLLRCPLVCSTCYPCPPTKLLPMCPDRTERRSLTAQSTATLGKRRWRSLVRVIANVMPHLRCHEFA